MTKKKRSSPWRVHCWICGSRAFLDGGHIRCSSCGAVLGDPGIEIKERHDHNCRVVYSSD